ncbi:hypothetical protein [Idiomarina seosinensis]|uniref:DUF2157 domain-containing protein n=1 Tax=Idiomarina seosinensis TaxID=281739 RepID=A0A432ZBR3_9GAMM|nr:hypothetical protein [Idiomarina seosinensis]RUO75378.1 hypothetical protein CWI81_10420 [Idiomarina seosinensis]
MYTDDDLHSAVQEGVISEQSASDFRQFVEERRNTHFQDEEHVRFVSGFNDIFVVIAAVVTLVASWTLGNLIGFGLGGLLVAASSWIMSEYFSRKRQMALPSIVLLLTCLGGVYFSAFFGFKLITGETELAAMLATAVTTLISVAHWLRFRVPIAFATSLGLLMVTAFVPLEWWIESTVVWQSVIFLAGVLVFAIALYWDRKDTLRQTRSSDIAFWLHLVAAPMLVNPLFAGITKGDFDIGIAQALITVAVYALLSVTSLIIDRRALMVSALAYVFYVFASLLTNVGLVDLATTITGLVIGIGLLLVSSQWHGIRAILLNQLPPRLQAYVPPIS